MSRLAKWKLEKTKVKVVFRLQFHATHVPQTGWDKLFISFIPADSGKATAKTTKANIKNGTCKWSDPIYESTRLLQDSKTKCFDEKLYRFVVAMGTSRSSILGEANINLADYVDASKPSVVALPLHGCDTGTILHVTVQLLTSKTGFREFEQQRDLREKGFQRTNDQLSHEDSSGGKISSSEMSPNDQFNKVNTKVKLKPETRDHSLNEEEVVGSSIRYNNSPKTPESIYVEKHDTSSTHELESLKSTMSDHRSRAQRNNDWESEYSVDNDLAIAYEENSKLKASLELAESSINELKLEVSSFQNQAGEINIKAQKIFDYFSTEIASGEKLAKEVSFLKSECVELKSDLENFKKFKINPSFPSTENIDIDATNAMKGNFSEILRELDDSKIERETLTRKMNQMESYYEALIQDLEENQKRVLEELQNLRNENSTLLYTMEEQTNRYTEERREFDVLNKELEQRVVSSESALKRARMNYSIAVDQLQKDLELLSSQVVSMFETNENLIRESFSEYENAVMKKQVIRGDTIIDDTKQSLYSQEELYKKVEEEVCEVYLKIINLEVFSKTLQEILLEATSDSRCMKEKLDGIALRLEFATESNELLMQRLQSSMKDVQVMKAKFENVNNDNCRFTQKIKEYEAMEIELGNYKRKYEACVVEKTELQRSMKDIQLLEAKLESVLIENSVLTYKIKEYEAMEIELENHKSNYEACHVEKTKLESSMKDIQILEAKLESFYVENGHFTQKIKEYEAMEIELENYKSKYEACVIERTELANSLKHEAQENDTLRTEISFLQGRVKSVKDDFDNMVSLKETLQNTFDLVKYNLGNLLLTYNKQFPELSLWNKPVNDEMEHKDLMSIVSQLEEVQYNASSKIIKLTEDYKEANAEKDFAKSEIIAVKNKFENELLGFVNKIDLTNAHVQKLELDLEILADKLNLTSEIEEKISQLNEELVSNIASFEFELQEITLKNKDIAQEILELETVSEALGKEKLIISEFTGKNQDLMKNLQEKTNESLKLASELISVKQCLKSLTDELHLERGLRDELKNTTTELTFQINEKNKTLELEKSRYNNLLIQFEECFKKVDKDHSSLIDLEAELFEICLLLIASDINLVFSRTQYEDRIQELFQLVQSSEKEVKEVQKKHLDLESLYVEENENLRSENTQVKDEVDRYKTSISNMEITYSKNQDQYEQEIRNMKFMLSNFEKNIDVLIFSNEKVEIEGMLLKAKLGELKNLLIHYKEVKEKAETECHEMREKRELERNSLAAQDSLRIVFIKDQYETELQELKHHLSISKKQGDEMLWKLQDTMDELENKKKSEASILKKNEELLTRVSDLEISIREKVNVFDRIKAESECSLISLECCKEEKERVEASLRGCNEEKAKIEDELFLVKEKLELLSLAPNSIVSCEKAENTSSISQEGENSNGDTNVQSMQDTLVSRGVTEIPRHPLIEQRNSMHNEFENLAIINNRFKTEILKSSMDRLHNELEKMKNENLLPSQDIHLSSNPKFPGLDRELMQLHKANEDLESLFPFYNQLSANGNALERVLALEVELAESLQLKNKSSFQIQSSFLKQHSDEEAVFKSFKYINDLIKDMLEIKGKYTKVEAELQEMHDRYSQLSLQFAEVEGEKQKLVMTLKNVRSPKKHPLFNHSSSATLVDSSS